MFVDPGLLLLIPFGLNNHECVNHKFSLNANVSEAFSKFFSEKFNNVRTTLKRINQASNTIDQLYRDKPFAGLLLAEFPSATIDEVEAIIRRSSSKSCDLDPLPTALLKLCLPELSATLLSIINHSLDIGVVPSHFKNARVTPVRKSRATSSDDVSNYRPISQLPFISKVLERVVSNRIRPHLEEYHLFDKYQSAYREAHSTETALLRLRVHHDITSALDKGSTVAVVMLDQSAAFDVIDHDILLQRLEFAFGISGRALKWFGSYLQDRSQCVCVRKDVSKTLPVVCGVPQGSVLGPLLYTVYTKSIGEICQRHNVLYHCYADDIQLYYAVEGSEDLAEKLSSINECIDGLKSWMGWNMLKLNSEKTEFILLRKSLLVAIRHHHCLGTCET